MVDKPLAMIDQGYISPGNAAESILFGKISDPPPFGARMPFGGPYLTDTQIGAVKSWINSLQTVTLLVVTPSGGHVTITPSDAQQVKPGKTAAFTVVAEAGFTLPDAVGGTCPAGSWTGSTYTTGEITADCDVQFGSYNVTPVANSSITMSPSVATAVAIGKTLTLALTPTSGKTIDKTNIGGGCAAGTWSGNDYTTGAVTKDCSISFKVEGQISVTASALAAALTFDAASKSVDSYSKASFTLTVPTIIGSATQASGTASTAPSPSAYSINTSAVASGTCPTGTWSGSTYTTGTLTADCTVVFSETAMTNPCGTSNTASTWTAVSGILSTCGATSCHSTSTSRWVSGVAAAASTTPLYAFVRNGYVFNTTAGTTGTTYAVAASQPGAGGSANLVRPGDPMNSRLYRKVTTAITNGTTGLTVNQMPRNLTKLSQAEQDTICNWIYNGALNN